MSTTATPPPTPPDFMGEPPRPRRSGARTAAIWLGAAAATFGALIAIAGGGIFAVFGADGVLSTGRHDLSTPTSALVSGTASINDSAGVADALGDARIKISARADGGRAVFVGVGRSADVDRYLAGAATDEVTDFNGGVFGSSFSVDRTRHAGGAVPASPATQSFWVARSTGRDVAAVDWKIRDGNYRVVIMNADGSRGVDTRSAFGVDIPYLPGVGIGILVVGLLITAGGVAAITAGARRPRA